MSSEQRTPRRKAYDDCKAFASRHTHRYETREKWIQKCMAGRGFKYEVVQGEQAKLTDYSL